MSARGRRELLCGVGSGLFGLLLLRLAYLQPHGYHSDTSSSQLAFSPGFTPIETPYIIAIGIPILCIVIGATVHSLSRSASILPLRLLSSAARPLLWLATAVLALEAAYGLIEIIGLVLAPSAALGVCASLLARDAQSGGAAQRGARHALI